MGWELGFYDHPTQGWGWWLFRAVPPALFTVNAASGDEAFALSSASLYVLAGRTHDPAAGKEEAR